MNSTAKSHILYRGIVIEVRAERRKNISGEIETIATASVRGGRPEIKELDFSDIPDKYIKEITLKNDSQLKYVSAHQIGSQVNVSYSSITWNPNKPDSFIQHLKNLIKKPPEPSLSQKVEHVVEKTQQAIDGYIEAHDIELDVGEVHHGIDRTMSQELDEVEVRNPTFNDETEFNSRRPSSTDIAESMIE